jgi:hypothetical protein
MQHKVSFVALLIILQESLNQKVITSKLCENELNMNETFIYPRLYFLIYERKIF